VSRVKCWKVKACEWEGSAKDLVMIPGKPISGVEVKDATCPRCGGKTFRPAFCKIVDLNVCKHAKYFGRTWPDCTADFVCENQTFKMRELKCSTGSESR
jgi:hypothetical protein